MRESKEFRTLAAKSSPRRSSWSFVKFEDCQKGQTAAKTGCTPASGEGTKKESGEAGDTQSKLDKLEKETMDSMRDMPTDHPDFDKTATKMQKIAEAKIVDKARSGETEEAQAMAEEAGLEYEEVLKDAEKAAKEGVDILEDLLGFPKEDRAEIKSDKKKEKWDWQKDGIPPDSSNTIGKKVGDVHGGKIAGRTKEKHESGGDTIYIKRDTRGWSGPQDPFVKVVVDKEGNVTHDYGSVPSLDSGPGPR
jgi:hypothetical protein